MRPLAPLHRRHQRIDGIDIRRAADLGDHDLVQPVAGLFQQVHHVAIPEGRVQPVDPHRQQSSLPQSTVADRLDDCWPGPRPCRTGATESSRSRLITSAALAAILANSAGREPGPNSWQRFGRAGRGVAGESSCRSLRQGCFVLRLAFRYIIARTTSSGLLQPQHSLRHCSMIRRLVPFSAPFSPFRRKILRRVLCPRRKSPRHPAGPAAFSRRTVPEKPR